VSAASPAPARKRTLARDDFLTYVEARLDAGDSTRAITATLGRTYNAVFSRLDRAERFDLLKRWSDRRAVEAFDRQYDRAVR
jgi:hypothetical protein